MSLQSEIKSVVKWQTPAVTVQSSLREVIQEMIHSNTSALVVKSENDVVGVITDMDLLACPSGKCDLDETKVPELMTPCDLITSKPAKNPCVQLGESESVANAIRALSASGTHNLVVSGAGDDKVGIVSISDLLKLTIS